MKRWFDPEIISRDCGALVGSEFILWEWDSETNTGTWVTRADGISKGPSGLELRYFEHLHTEVFPVWRFPRELRTPEGL